MAAGDLTLFEEFSGQLGLGIHDLNSDTLKLGLVDDTLTPLANVESPTWATYSDNEVAVTGNYTEDGETVANTAYSEADGVGTLAGDDVVIAQDADNGFQNAYWGILYNASSGSDEAIAFIDLGGPVSERSGEVTIAWNESGILTTTVT